MDGPLPTNIDFVLGVIEHNLVPTIVVSVIRVIGFGGIEETVCEHTTRRRHVHIELRVPRVRELERPIDPSLIEVDGCGVPGDAG